MESGAEPNGIKSSGHFGSEAAVKGCRYPLCRERCPPRMCYCQGLKDE